MPLTGTIRTLHLKEPNAAKAIAAKELSFSQLSKKVVEPLDLVR
jgi:hypothetical protein